MTNVTKWLSVRLVLNSNCISFENQAIAPFLEQ